MRTAEIDDETSNVCENVTINPIITRRSLLNTQRNPFHTSTASQCQKPKNTNAEMEKRRLSSQISSNASPQNASFLLAPAEKHQRHREFPIPRVAFPYITDMNADLESNFDMILDSLPALPCEVELRRVKLPPSPKLKTLVLGLEGTLVAEEGEASSAVLSSQRRETPKMRPHLQEFLEALSPRFEIIVFSTSSKRYTAEVLRMIDPEQRLIAYAFDESSCIIRNEKDHLKDLRILQCRSLERTIIVDSKPLAFQAQIENGIYIPAYLGDDNDVQLPAIQQFLLSMDEVVDVRPLVKKFAGIIRLLTYYSTERPEDPPLTSNVESTPEDDRSVANEFD